METLLISQASVRTVENGRYGSQQLLTINVNTRGSRSLRLLVGTSIKLSEAGLSRPSYLSSGVELAPLELLSRWRNRRESKGYKSHDPSRNKENPPVVPTCSYLPLKQHATAIPLLL